MAEDRTLDRDQISLFLAALTKLSREHGIAVQSCGCCGGAFLRPHENASGLYITRSHWDNLDWCDSRGEMDGDRFTRAPDIVPEENS